MGYLKETLSEKELFQLTYDKGKSQDSVQVLKSSLANFEYFTKDQLDKTRLQVLDDLSEQYEKNRDTKAPIVLLNQFKEWIDKPHPNILITVGNGGKLALKAKSGRAQKSYLSNV